LHFDKYPLITQKEADFILFKKVIDIMNRKEHLTIEGLEKIVSIKAYINLGLSEELKSDPQWKRIVPIQRPLIQNKKILDPYWMAGFASGEACFLINIYKSQTKLG
jgi:hypothetical protein